MATAMHQGRRPAIIFALGVVAGSTLWGLLAAFGLSAVMAQHSQALVALKMTATAITANRSARRIHALGNPGLIRLFCQCKAFLYFGLEMTLHLFDMPMGQGLMFGSVGVDLGAVQTDPANL
jgi:hypothetical protein